MDIRRVIPYVAALFALLMAGCSLLSRQYDIRTLSLVSAEAYVVLMDQLERMAADPAWNRQELNFCVATFLPGRPDEQVDPMLLEALRTNMPRRLSATLMLQSDCRNPQGFETLLPNGEYALILHAAYNPELPVSEGRWSVSSGCAIPCGHGDIYRVVWNGNQPVATLINTYAPERTREWTPFFPL